MIGICVRMASNQWLYVGREGGMTGICVRMVRRTYCRLCIDNKGDHEVLSIMCPCLISKTIMYVVHH